MILRLCAHGSLVRGPYTFNGLRAYLDKEIENIEFFSRGKFFVKTTSGDDHYRESDNTMSCDSQISSLLQTTPFTLSPINKDDYSPWNSGDATPFNSNGVTYSPSTLYTATDTAVTSTNGLNRLFRPGTGANNGDFQYASDCELFLCRGNDCGGSVLSEPLIRKKKSQAIDIVDPRTGEKILL
ncbi:Hypothetical protein CINCED_3A017896 [Cinara cedri]|uniref:Uncharacterized protein n=1 Tax=Cinara cedri TaxID=506608 RepID=A0A5E4MDA0_9HEMI|nr:Hypothetical protein CINCED_3A017896 [Cinara cedri]